MKIVFVAIVWVAWFTFWNQETERRVQQEEPKQEQVETADR